MSIASLTLSNYIMVAELLGLWVMLGSNVHLSKRTIMTTRIVIILIFVEAICWGVERYTREIGYLIREDNLPSWKTIERAGFSLTERKMYRDINDANEELYRFYSAQRNQQI